jgi:hypothetical protein
MALRRIGVDEKNQLPTVACSPVNIGLFGLLHGADLLSRVRWYFSSRRLCTPGAFESSQSWRELELARRFCGSFTEGAIYMRIPFIWSAGVTLVVLAACASSGPSVTPPAPTAHDSVTVHVLNQNYWDATVYWIYEGEVRRRLGIVRGNQDEAEFKVPWSPRMLAFEVDLIVAGGVYLSQQFSVSPGGYVDLTLPSNLQSSGFFRRIGF